MTLLARPIDFYFDFSSPYSYIASEWVDCARRAPRPHGELEGHPARRHFPGRRAEEPVSYLIKREYSLHDLSARRVSPACRRRTRRSSRYRRRTPRACSAWLADSDAERARQWARQCFRAYFARGVDLSDAAQLRARRGLRHRRRRGGSGVERPGLEGAAEGREQAAIAAGVFGAPSSSSTASPSGATTAGRRSSAGWRRGRSDAHAWPQVVCQNLPRLL